MHVVRVSYVWNVINVTFHCNNTFYFSFFFSCSSSSSFSSRAQSVVNLGFQYNLPHFPTLSDRRLPVFYFLLISVFFIILFSLFPPTQLLQIVFAFFGFAFFQYDHINVIDGILYNLQYLPLAIYPVSAGWFLFASSVLFPLTHIISGKLQIIQQL